LNAGLGNLGVSAMQFLVPLDITAGVFGAFGGSPDVRRQRGDAAGVDAECGFIWVPFIVASTLAAWFGMHDVASAKASFGEQAIIFGGKE